MDHSLSFGTEDALLAAMGGWLALPNEDSPAWDEDGWAWAASERLLAAAQLTGERGWRSAAIRVFELAADWDVHGAMLGLRHGPESAFRADSELFAAGLIPLLSNPHAGARRAAAHELGILRELGALAPLLGVADRDPLPAVAEQAENAAWLLAQEHPEAVDALRRREAARTISLRMRLTLPGISNEASVRPARLSVVRASRHASWTIHNAQRNDTGNPKRAAGSLLLDDGLALVPGQAAGHGLVFPQDWNEWQHLRPGDRVTLEPWPAPLAHAIVL